MDELIGSATCPKVIDNKRVIWATAYKIRDRIVRLKVDLPLLRETESLLDQNAVLEMRPPRFPRPASVEEFLHMAISWNGEIWTN